MESGPVAGSEIASQRTLEFREAYFTRFSTMASRVRPVTSWHLLSSRSWGWIRQA